MLSNNNSLEFCLESISPHQYNGKSNIQIDSNVNQLLMNKKHTINLSIQGTTHHTYEHVQICTYKQILIIETKKHKSGDTTVAKYFANTQVLTNWAVN